MDNPFSEAQPFYDDAKLAVRKHFSPHGNETPAQVQRNAKATAAAWVEIVIGLG